MLEDWQPGVRVVVRRRLPDGSATDVVGTLLATRPDVVVVATARGEVSVDVADVVAAKTVPPRPARRGPAHLALSVLALEDVMADGWRALETEWLGGPGGWLLRASQGFTGRGNSALPLTPTPPLADQGPAADRDLGPTLAAVTRWYAARDLPATVVLPEAPGDDDERAVPGLRAALQATGWAERSPTEVMVASAREVAAPAPLPRDLRLDLSGEPDEGWLSLYRYRGQQLPPVALRLLLSAPCQQFASVRSGDDTVAVGRLAVSRGWGGITAMEVAPSHRRLGLGRAVLAALARRSVELRAPSLYLQVAAENTPGRALYGSVGFSEHHRYSYWSPTPSS